MATKKAAKAEKKEKVVLEPTIENIDAVMQPIIERKAFAKGQKELNRFPDSPEKSEYQKQLNALRAEYEQAKADKAEASKRMAAKVVEVVGKHKAARTVNAKLADPEGILKAYDKLIDLLAETESSQRNKKKPYRIYFVHRKRAEVMRLNFVKSMR